MRSRYGEKINDNSFLIREQFDIRDKFAIGVCKGIGREVLQWKLRDIARRSNVRSKQVPIAHGFRKFFTTQLVNAKVNPEIREMLLGHKIGLAGCYYKPTEEEMFAEYEKAIDNLTINEEHRLKNKMKQLESEKSQIELLEIKHTRQMQEVRKELEPLLETKKYANKGGDFERAHKSCSDESPTETNELERLLIFSNSYS
jgi:hypothetical protein